MKKFLFYFAVTGWFLGLIVHLLSVAGIDVTDTIPFVWILHIGIFVVWLPIGINLKNNEEYKAFQQARMQNKANLLELYKVLFRQTPKWLTIVAVGGFFYSIINFILFMIPQFGSPEANDGHYFLSNHGQQLKDLTEQEFHKYNANEMRGFSGHWIAFYGIAVALLFPFKRQDNQ